MHRAITPALSAMLAVIPTAALAHTGVGETSGFMHGFSHPPGGIDHVLAMVLVGILAFQLGGRALWLVPATFVLVMAVGGALGIAEVPVPYVELGIGLSVVVFGAIVAAGTMPSAAIAMGVVGLFAIFHGHAHGSEMPQDASGLAYAAGFMLATALLHGAGLALGFVASRIGQAYGRAAFQIGGGLATLAGLAILLKIV